MIKVLDSWIADKIAAGEVIERPLSIVKEMVENSVDAGSESIIVEIKNGGKSYIRVTDNGCGIAEEEIETAFLRHATSKISSISDLEAVNTLGFRGEALASIAAVSRLTIVSRTEEQSGGTKLVMHGGQIVSKSTVGANKGTTIVVEDVFYNTPARKKFMKSDAAEASAIIEYVNSMAVYYADIRFMLINNGNTILNTAGDGNVKNVITSIFPSSDFRNLIEVKSDNVRAYISDPGTTRPNRKAQLFYVNGRLVGSKVIEEGINKGYGDRIFSGYPIAIVFIDINPAETDVNIHPGKREIKFLDSAKLVQDVSSAISSAMHREESIPQVKSREAMPINNDEQLDVRSFLGSLVREEDDSDYSANLPRQSTFDKPKETVSELSDNIYDNHQSIHPDFDWDNLKLSGYILNTYIIMENQTAVYLIDQHAAHERIFYEKLLKSYNSELHKPQAILTPFIIDTSADIYNADRDWMNRLSDMGYDIEDFGGGSFIIKGIPEFMNIEEAHAFASAFISMLGEYSANSYVIDKLIVRSCKAAVKSGDMLSKVEIEKLVHDLSLCNNPFSCPHGRPTLVKISEYEIERIFKRK